MTGSLTILSLPRSLWVFTQRLGSAWSNHDDELQYSFVQYWWPQWSLCIVGKDDQLTSAFCTKAYQQQNFLHVHGTFSGPEITIFNQSWINHIEAQPFTDEDLLVTLITVQMIIPALTQITERKHPQDDYREHDQLSIICLGELLKRTCSAKWDGWFISSWRWCCFIISWGSSSSHGRTCPFCDSPS